MHPDDYEDDEFVYAERPNKTKLKRELQAVQDFVKALIALPNSHFEQVPMDEDLRDAVLLARRIEKAALQRQIRYITKRIDIEEMDEMQAVMDRLALPQRQAVTRLHRLEGWRDGLIAGDSELLTELINILPDLDTQHLRQLVRNAKREAANNKPPKSSRLIYKYLDELDDTVH